MVRSDALSAARLERYKMGLWPLRGAGGGEQGVETALRVLLLLCYEPPPALGPPEPETACSLFPGFEPSTVTNLSVFYTLHILDIYQSARGLPQHLYTATESGLTTFSETHLPSHNMGAI